MIYSKREKNMIFSSILPNSRFLIPHAQQKGAVLIIVLWFVTIATVLVATLATEIRLSATLVFHNKSNVQLWADTLAAVRMAEMELLMARMPPDEEYNAIPLSERRNRLFYFDGHELDLAYPAPKTVKVRAYDHAGKIDLLTLPDMQLYELLKNRIGDDPEKLNALLDAWRDWKDRDELKRINGAEKEDYYEKLEIPYAPRNGNLETVDELLLIKGFNEVFKDVNLDAAFTIYGGHTKINPNIATREALKMVPGLDEGSINTILTKRVKEEFKSNDDLSLFMDGENLSQAMPWIDVRKTTNYYTIAIQPKSIEELKALEESEENGDEPEKVIEKQRNELLQENQPSSKKEENAYMITVQILSMNRPAKVLMVNPYGILPDTRHENMVYEEEN